MSKSGGIAYLLKHGRAPLPAITRTEQPRRGNTSVRGYASGGSTVAPANKPLNYEGIPNYEYSPSSQNVAPHYELGPEGVLRYVPGRYYSGLYGGATGSAATGSGAGQGGGGGGGSGGGGGGSSFESGEGNSGPDSANTPDPDSFTGHLAQMIQDIALNSTLGKAVTTVGNMLGLNVTPLTVAEQFAVNQGQAIGPQGGGGMAISVNNDPTDSEGSGEAAAAANLATPDVQAAIANEAPTITEAMTLAAQNEGMTLDGPEGSTTSTTDTGTTTTADTSVSVGDTGTSGDASEARGGLNLNGRYYPRKLASGGIAALAEGGAANAPLNFDNVPNYEFTPAANIAPSMQLGPDGRLIYVPGKYSSGLYSGQMAPKKPVVAAAPTDAAPRERSGGNGRSYISPVTAILNAAYSQEAQNQRAAEVTAMAQQAAYSQEAQNQRAQEATAMAAAADAARVAEANRAAGPVAGGGGGPQGPTPTGGGVAANPMGRDPATAQGQRSDGSDGRGGGGSTRGQGEGGTPGASMGGPNGGGRGPTSGNGDAVGGWYKNGRFHQPAYATGGIAALAGGGHPQGPRLLSGGGDGLSDSIPAVIGRNQPARLADGEFVVSADVVSALGGGSTKAGAKKLYAMMDRIRQNAHGTKKQVKKLNDRKVLPA